MVVRMLNQIFSSFDELTLRFGLEKVKTIGDAYMLVGGAPDPREDHAEAVAEMALAMLAVLAQFNKEANKDLRMRIGMHTGPVVAGVIGSQKYAYDLWGSTVNTASRMESSGIPGRIHVSEATYSRLARLRGFGPFDKFFEMVSRGISRGGVFAGGLNRM
jgi:class 3 adenylate cyclase